MKKVLIVFVLIVLMFSCIGCDIDSLLNGEETLGDGFNIDFENAESFELALNNGSAVKGKIVKFYVKEYAPDSALGINCHAGEHLNFIFEDELNVKTGDTVVVRISKAPSKIFLVGSWEIPCELVEIIKKQIQTENNSQATDESNTESIEMPSQKITVTMSENELINMTTVDAEKKLREMGFSVFQYESLDAGDQSDLDGKIGAVEIKSWEFGKGDFSKGDVYEKDAIVVLMTYKSTYKEPEKPEPLYYSTNDYETAKKGNTGVFSYKNKSGSYDVYWIIDFDAGYVYYFTEGNGENSCDKVKIVSGDLNDRIVATWHLDGDEWSWYLHFKYKNFSETLVVNDHNGFATEFRPTDLEDALSLRSTKEIKNY